MSQGVRLRLRVGALGLIGVLGVAGCGGGALRRAETAHIRLTTDEPSRYAQRFAAEMERTLRGLAESGRLTRIARRGVS